METVASPEWLLRAVSFSPVVDAPVELRRGSTALLMLVARRSSRVCSPLAGCRETAAPVFEDQARADADQAGVHAWCRMEVQKNRGPSTSRPLRGASQSKRGGGLAAARRRSVLRCGEDTRSQKDFFVFLPL